MIRFSHTLFALPFALLAAVMAWRQSEAFRWQEFVGILCCMVFARSAAMAFNRLIDRKLDANNPRTATRHLPSGELSVVQVSFFAMLCSLGFVASTLWFLPNRLPLYLSIPVLLVLLGYSYAKRFTLLVHYWLGFALALSPLAAWIAIRGNFVARSVSDLKAPALLGLAVLSWVAGFDILYACQDAEFDRAAKLHSIPARFGIKNALRIAMFSHLVTICALLGLWYVYPFFTVFFAGFIALVACLLAYQHYLVRPEDLSRVNIAFFHVNAVISLGLFAVGTLDLWLHYPR